MTAYTELKHQTALTKPIYRLAETVEQLHRTLDSVGALNKVAAGVAGTLGVLKASYPRSLRSCTLLALKAAYLRSLTLARARAHTHTHTHTLTHTHGIGLRKPLKCVQYEDTYSILELIACH